MFRSEQSFHGFFEKYKGKAAKHEMTKWFMMFQRPTKAELALFDIMAEVFETITETCRQQPQYPGPIL